MVGYHPSIGQKYIGPELNSNHFWVNLDNDPLKPTPDALTSSYHDRKKLQLYRPLHTDIHNPGVARKEQTPYFTLQNSFLVFIIYDYC